MKRSANLTKLEIALQPSALFTLLQIALHALAVSALFYSTILTSVKVLGVIIILISLGISLQRKVILLAAQCYRHLQRQTDNTWLLMSSHGHNDLAYLHGDSILLGRFAILHFTLLQRRGSRRVVLMPDNLKRDEWRNLHRALRQKECYQ